MKKIIFLIILFPILLSASYSDTHLVVIVNIANTTEQLTQSRVKLIYLRKIAKRWSSINKNIIPVDQKNSPEIKDLFLNKILAMTEDDLNRYYTEREYENAELPPVEVASDAEVIDFVSNNIGAIGYININSLNDSNKNKVKIVYP